VCLESVPRNSGWWHSSPHTGQGPRALFTSSGASVVYTFTNAHMAVVRLSRLVGICVVLSNIIAPTESPQIRRSKLRGVEHPLAPEVMAAMSQGEQTPARLWKTINALADAWFPDSRGRRRFWRLRYWSAIRALLRAGCLFRHGPFIATSEFRTMPKPGPPGCSRNADGTHHPWPSVGISTTKTAGSNGVAGRADKAVNGAQAPEFEIVAANLSEVPSSSEVKSVPPTLADVSAAARVLARRPRRGKKWSGWLGRTRMRRLRQVIVPGGQVLPAYVVRRGWVYVVLPDTPEYEGRVFERYPAQDVQIYRSPHAALLGRQPPKPGNRPRGRPTRQRPS
jgi:hypothetical protein